MGRGLQAGFMGQQEGSVGRELQAKGLQAWPRGLQAGCYRYGADGPVSFGHGDEGRGLQVACRSLQAGGRVLQLWGCGQRAWAWSTRQDVGS